jgi:uncharacterized protein YndB with AHSA1/START domain
MSFQNNPDIIQWHLHLKSPPHKVHELIATDQGRAKFWAESAVEVEGQINFRFPDGQTWQGQVIENQPPNRFVVEYFGGSLTTFELAGDGAGGTDLVLTDAGVPEADRTEVTAGWVSVLMALKAAVDFSVDLRNHDLVRTWEQGFVDN